MPTKKNLASLVEFPLVGVGSNGIKGGDGIGSGFQVELRQTSFGAGSAFALA